MMQQTNHARLLYLVKQFYLEAINLAAVGDDWSAMKAVLFLDLSIEQMLYVLIADFGLQGPNGPDEPTWKQLWQQALKAVKDQSAMTKFPHYPELRTLHGLRNQAQHQGVAPNPTELGRFRRAALSMLSTCFQEAYGFSFTTFEPWDEIRNPNLQRLLRESQEALEGGDVLMTLTGTLVAFQKIIAALKRSQFIPRERLRRRHELRPQLRVDSPHYSDLLRVVVQAQRVITQVEESVSEMHELLHEQILISRLGLSLYEMGKYRQLTENLTVKGIEGGMWDVYVERQGIDETDRDSGRFAVSYVTQLLLVAQDEAPAAVAEIRIPMPLTEQLIWKKRRQEGVKEP